jgi:hypothetical protein
MRCLVTGNDAEGRSCVVDTIETAPPDGEVDVRSLLRLRTDALAPRPGGAGEHRDLGVPHGRLQWVVSRWAAGAAAPTVHHTDTVDLDLVVAGQIDLVLDTGTHRLEQGDCAVINGVDHAWRAGPDGCTLSVVLLGTPAP